jgi:hypothetical protein
LYGKDDVVKIGAALHVLRDKFYGRDGMVLQLNSQVKIGVCMSPFLGWKPRTLRRAGLMPRHIRG